MFSGSFWGLGAADGRFGRVGSIHPKAMSVTLATRDEIDTWMTAPAGGAIKLQIPLADDALVIVGRGEKEDLGGLAA
jgi:hypothetical protein